MRAADSPCVQLRGDTTLVLTGGFTAAGSGQLQNNTTVSANISICH